jgi:hypothetical protein
MTTPRSEHILPYWPLEDWVSQCIRGRSNPDLKSVFADDHASELCLLALDDTEDHLFFESAPPEGRQFIQMLQRLSARARSSKDLEAAKLIYAIAVHASEEVLSIYLRHRSLFDQITPYRKTLPCLASIHPKTAKVVAQMQRDSRLGTRTDDAQRIRSKAYFTSDKPANVYARAIVDYVYANRDLEPVAVQQRSWKKFDRENGVRTIVAPFPKHQKGIKQLPAPLAPENVLKYWRFGKRVMQAEMPDFHLRTEWRTYHNRKYANGAKKGAIQHAIFKDILTALRALAGKDSRPTHDVR